MGLGSLNQTKEGNSIRSFEQVDVCDQILGGIFYGEGSRWLRGIKAGQN